MNTAFLLLGLFSTCLGAISIYLAASRQMLLAAPWPSIPARLGGVVLIMIGGALLSREMAMGPTIFAVSAILIVAFSLLPFLAVLKSSLGKKPS